MQIKSIILAILILLYFVIVIFLPYILGVIMAFIVIRLTRKKISGDDKEFRRKVYTLCVGICVILAPLWYNYATARPDDTYVKMQELNEKQSLIGLSKEQILELLGEPYGNKEEDTYYYDAGKITDYIAGGTNEFYNLEIVFDENGKVKSTSIEMVP